MKIRPTRARGRSIERVTAENRREKPLFARVTHRALGESDACAVKTHARKLAYTHTPCARFPPARLTSSPGIAIEICRITWDILNKLIRLIAAFASRLET